MMKPSPFLLLAAAVLSGCVVIDYPAPSGSTRPYVRPVLPAVTRPVPHPPAARPPSALTTAEYIVRLHSSRISPSRFAAEHGLQYVRTMRSDPAQHLFRGPALPGFLLGLRNDPAVLSATPNSSSQNQRGRNVP